MARGRGRPSSWPHAPEPLHEPGDADHERAQEGEPFEERVEEVLVGDPEDGVRNGSGRVEHQRAHRWPILLLARFGSRGQHGSDSVQGVTLEGVSLRTSPLTREALAASGGAAAVSALLVWMVPPGADFAAHVYQRAVFVQHGFALWNNFWYAGRYSFVTYSLIYYPLAALVGIRVLAVMTISAAALAFAFVVIRQWGAEAV